MHQFDRVVSLVTLLSMFMLPQLFGRFAVVWWGNRRKLSVASQHVALAFSTFAALVILASIYGVFYSISPRSVIWYNWINSQLPITGDVDLNSEVEVRGPVEVNGKVVVENDSLSVRIENEPITVKVEP